MRLKSKRGFSLIEVLTASAIFLISFSALTGLVAMITNRRNASGKHASMTRLAGEEYQRFVRQGYDALVAPVGLYPRTDPDGRQAYFTVTVNDDCKTSPKGSVCDTATNACSPSRIGPLTISPRIEAARRT